MSICFIAALKLTQLMPSIFKSLAQAFIHYNCVNIANARTEYICLSIVSNCVVDGFNSKSFVHEFGDSDNVLMMYNNIIILFDTNLECCFIQNGHRTYKLATNKQNVCDT